MQGNGNATQGNGQAPPTGLGLKEFAALQDILDNVPASEWLTFPDIQTIAQFRHHPPTWAQIKARFRELGQWPPELEQAVDHYYPRQVAAVDFREPIVTSMDQVTGQPVHWLWWPYLPLGKLVLLDGDPGVGKSLFTLQLAAALSRGWPLPDQEGKTTLATGQPSTTILIAREDSLSDTVKPRLDAAGADASRVKVFHSYAGQDSQVHNFTFQDLALLERVMKEHEPRLVIIDPLQAYLGSRVDMSKSNQTRPYLEALGTLAERSGCTILVIRHFTKPGEGSAKAIHRGMGGMDFMGAARTGLGIEQHPCDPGKALLFQHKSNVGPLGRTQAFSKAEGRFEWCDVSRITAEDLAGSGRGPDPRTYLSCLCWLEHRLEGGLPWPAKDIETEAEQEGYKGHILFRAKKTLGVKGIRAGFGTAGSWTWLLPQLDLLPPPSTT
jgi:AAA domain-containing protein